MTDAVRNALRRVLSLGINNSLLYDQERKCCPNQV